MQVLPPVISARLLQWEHGVKRVEVKEKNTWERQVQDREGAGGLHLGSPPPTLPRTRRSLGPPPTAPHLNLVRASSTKQCPPSRAAGETTSTAHPRWCYAHPNLPPAPTPRCCRGIVPVSLDIFPCSRGTYAPVTSPCTVPLA